MIINYKMYIKKFNIINEANNTITTTIGELLNNKTLYLVGENRYIKIIISGTQIERRDYTELQKRTYIVKTFSDVCKDLIDIFGILKSEFK